MIRVTTHTKVQMPSPDQGWTCTPGANHFDSEIPDAVAARLAKLQTDGVVKVERLDGTGSVSPWPSGVTDQ